MRGAVISLLALWLVACAGERQPSQEGRGALGPTRGYVLISIDALGAKHLGAYGGERDTSPFFDSLAARGALFERAAVQYPSTLTSHLSVFTGLYPGEHGVYPPAGVLAAEIPTLPERFRDAGFRTAGHTEGGFMAGGFGFARGFHEFTDSGHTSERDVERTFGRGLDFLRRLAPEERFFLFLHTYSVHDPYDPPAAERALFWSGEPPPGPPPTGPTLRRLNAASEPPAAELVRYFEALYAASVRYTDGVLARFFAELEALGLARETTVVITSDHGEEFGEHGRLGHTQLYPELLFVPLLVVHPELEDGVRVPTLVESIDLAPTLLDLAGLPPLEAVSGRSLAPLVRRPVGEAGEAYAEVLDERRGRTLLRAGQDGLYQLVASEEHPDPSGAWIGRSALFDTSEPAIALELRSFHRRRRVRLAAGEEVLAAVEVGTSWETHPVALGDGSATRRLRLAVDGCDSPASLGVSGDERCLGVQVASPPLWLTELYELRSDPGATADLRTRAEAHRRLARRLGERTFEPVSAAGSRPLDEETRRTLRALGYIE